ncbi:MAG: hypothetical protein V4502_07960 [Pseudomonadota bacterium]
MVTLLAAIFWAGAAYQRFGGMETHLISIDAQLTRIADVQAELIMLQDSEREHERRLAKLEDQVKALR